MKSVVGVRLRNTGESKYYSPGTELYHVGDKVIVEVAEGKALGQISVPQIEVEDDKFSPINHILRRATQVDIENYKKNMEDEREAFKVCLEKIQQRALPMKLIKAEYTLERNKLLFYFTADGRVDFRELVKDLAAIFHTRIELRQIGSRDETKYLGGIGICGREFCCNKFLTEFDPISVKMAKEQKLSLNPTKISGVCGRLMCCLKNEEETYEYLNKQLPHKGELVTTNDRGTGTVYAANVLKQRVSVLFEENDEKEIVEYAIDEITVCAKPQENNAQGKQKKTDEQEEKPKEPLKEQNKKEQKEEPKEEKPRRKKGNFRRDRKSKKQESQRTQ